MMALIFGGIMLLWFWGSSHRNAFFASHFNAHIKKLEDLLAVADSPDLTAPPQLRLVAENKPVGQAVPYSQWQSLFAQGYCIAGMVHL